VSPPHGTDAGGGRDRTGKLDQPPHLQSDARPAALEQMLGLEMRDVLHTLVVYADNPVPDLQKSLTSTANEDPDDLQRSSSVHIRPASQSVQRSQDEAFNVTLRTLRLPEAPGCLHSISEEFHWN